MTPLDWYLKGFSADAAFIDVTYNNGENNGSVFVVQDRLYRDPSGKWFVVTREHDQPQGSGIELATIASAEQQGESSTPPLKLDTEVQIPGPPRSVQVRLLSASEFPTPDARVRVTLEFTCSEETPRPTQHSEVVDLSTSFTAELLRQELERLARSFFSVD